MALNDVEHCEACQIHEDVVKAVTDHMPDEDQLYDLAEVFKVFGDSTRMKKAGKMTSLYRCTDTLFRQNRTGMKCRRSRMLHFIPIRIRASGRRRRGRSIARFCGAV